MPNPHQKKAKKNTFKVRNLDVEQVAKVSQNLEPEPRAKTEPTADAPKAVEIKSEPIVKNIQPSAIKTETEPKKTLSKKDKSDKSLPKYDPSLYPKLLITLILLVGMGFAVFVNGYFLPEVVLQNTDSAIAEKTKQEADAKIAESKAKKAESLATENQVLKFTNQAVAINLKDFGNLQIDLNDQAAPKTVENFVRLAHRKYFDGTVFHRMVESPTFNVIQGGDPTATGTGGETASGEPLVDEVWKVKPQSNPDKPGEFLNKPEFNEPSLYKDFDVKTGEVTYVKGQILMAKTQAPDSASSQFFITLTDTKLPAEYTVFGQVRKDSLPILDKISKEVDPISTAPEGAPETYKDGKPNKELKIESLVIL